MNNIYVVNKFDTATREIKYHLIAFKTEPEAIRYCRERHNNWLDIEYWYDAVCIGKLKE